MPERQAFSVGHTGWSQRPSRRSANVCRPASTDDQRYRFAAAGSNLTPAHDVVSGYRIKRVASAPRRWCGTARRRCDRPGWPAGHPGLADSPGAPESGGNSAGRSRRGATSIDAMPSPGGFGSVACRTPAVSRTQTSIGSPVCACRSSARNGTHGSTSPKSERTISSLLRTRRASVVRCRHYRIPARCRPWRLRIGTPSIFRG